jgi:hypothetical protein
MNRTLATPAAPLALAALLTLAMLAGTNALAGHQYRVAAAAAASPRTAEPVAMEVQRVVIVGRRIAQI